MDSLRTELQKIAPLTDPEWKRFVAITKTQPLAKGEFFLTDHAICQHSAFVSVGVLRHFRTDAKGHEKIIQFSLPGEFVSNCESHIHQKTSEYAIQAIETCELVVFKNSDLQRLSQENPAFDKIGRQVTHQLLASYKEHITLLLTYTPEQRYQYMLANKPALVTTVSVTHLSQFLGLTRETLSRIRGKVSM
ncbi:MAG: Crp/Fnr family transcriptional regulator [Cyclobacteriaceae bacterium]|jgi:CRP-like cAMP-binding protein|nr:Crp/Fnr family transcriptional regulator [Cyclobacteriaceae bacterium]